MWIDPALLVQFAREETTAHRLATTSEGWVERLGADLLISSRTSGHLTQLTEQARAWMQQHGVACERIFNRLLVRDAQEQQAPRLVFGPTDALRQTQVQEAGLNFCVDFEAGYSTGLFLDQRTNRTFLRSQAPTRALNCFAYTCSFSVAAAAAGAETMSVDLSKKSLTWGRRNFEANGIAGAGHRFLADDVFAVLPRLARRGETFDAIVLDPPTFSRNAKGKVFHAQRDWPRLLEAALAVAAPKARLLLSTNCAELRTVDLERVARKVLQQADRSGRFDRPIPLRDFPQGAGAATVWLTVG